MTCSSYLHVNVFLFTHTNICLLCYPQRSIDSKQEKIPAPLLSPFYPPITCNCSQTTSGMPFNIITTSGIPFITIWRVCCEAVTIWTRTLPHQCSSRVDLRGIDSTLPNLYPTTATSSTPIFANYVQSPQPRSTSHTQHTALSSLI